MAYTVPVSKAAKVILRKGPAPKGKVPMARPKPTLKKLY